MSLQPNQEAAAAVDCDMMLLDVHLTIYEAPTEYHTDSRTPEVSTIDLQTQITKGGSVAELKAVLESQDLIPEDSEDFFIEVRLSQGSPKLDDTCTITSSTTEVYLTVLPKSIPLLPPSLDTQSIRTPAVAPTTTAVPPSTPAIPTEALPFNGLTSLLSSLRPPPTVGGRIAGNGLGTTGSASPLNPIFNPFLGSSSTSTGGATGTGFQDDMAQALMADPAMMRQVMNSPVMRSLMSSPDILRSILDANPQMRELRERHPELNHLLNDPELLQQSMQAMQNPSLMREMISNTDRVLNNIDAVPGGFNALRRVYQSIQEPIWDVALGNGNNRTADMNGRHYDLQTEEPPSTRAIPNPWAPPRRPQASNLVPPSSMRRAAPPLMPFPPRSNTFSSRLPQTAPQTTPVSTTILLPTPTSFPPPVVSPGTIGISADSTNDAPIAVPTSPPATFTQSTSSFENSSDIVAFRPFASPETPPLVPPSDLEQVLPVEEAAPTPLANATRESHQDSTTPNILTPATDYVAQSLTDTEARQDTTDNASTTCVINGESSLSEAVDIQKETARNETVTTDEQTPDQQQSELQIGREDNKEGTTEQESRRLETIPFLFQSVYPNQHRLRSLGGLSLPNAAHITGVVRTPPAPPTKDDNDFDDDNDFSSLSEDKDSKSSQH